MRKIFVLLLVILFASMILVGCKGDDDTDNQNTNDHNTVPEEIKNENPVDHQPDDPFQKPGN